MSAPFELVRHGLRRLRRSPGYSVPVVLSLALGIGLNTAVFSVMEDVVRRPLPYPEESRLIAVASRTQSTDSAPTVFWSFFFRDIAAWLQGSRTLATFASFNPYQGVVAGPAGSEFVEGGMASDDLLRVLRAQPALGRWFAPEEVSSNARVVVLSDALWRRQFAANPGAVGQVLRISHEPWTVIGVLPSRVGLPLTAEFWTPSDARVAGAEIVARARPGVSLGEVARELTALAPSIANRRQRGTNSEVIAVPLRERLFGPARPVLRLLTGAAALLLLIACANIANLSLARTLERQRELAVRLTLGASKRSLVSLVLTENLLLAIAGSVVGLLLAAWGTRAVVALGPEEIARVPDVGIGASAIVYAVGISIVAALLVSIAPVITATDRGVQPLLAQAGTRVARGRASRRVRFALVATQLAVALLLITGAGLLIRSVQRLTRGERLGFSPTGLVIASVPLYGAAYRDDAFRDRFIRAFEDRVKSLPGVSSVAFGPPPLVGGRGEGLREGFNAILYHYDTIGGERRSTIVFMKHVDPGYLDTYGIRLRAGRNFQASDDASAPPVALVSASAARLYFRDRDPLGLTIDHPGFKRMGTMPPRVVGVVDDVLQRDLAMDANPEIFVPVAQQRQTITPTVAIRTSGPTAPLLSALRTALREIDPELAASRLQTMDSIVADSLQRHAFLLLLLGIFAALGLTLAAIGLYAVISYLVTQRTLEIGIRMALGAQRTDVFGLVLREGALLAGIGLVVGIPAALALSHILTSFLFEVQPHDLTTFAVAPLGLALVALFATFLPARRAAAVDPARAMRAE